MQSMRLMRATLAISTFIAAATLAGCGSGPVKRVSEPAVGIQQLTVKADGQWSVDVRIDNFSSLPMRFDTVTLVVTTGGEAAGTLSASPGIEIGPESADVVTVSLAPSSAARIEVADALASRRSLSYTLQGSVVATPDGGKPRTFQVDRGNSLNPAPGLPGVLR